MVLYSVLFALDGVSKKSIRFFVNETLHNISNLLHKKIQIQYPSMILKQDFPKNGLLIKL